MHQKSLSALSTTLIPGQRYTLVTYSQFGFLRVHHIRMHEVRLKDRGEYGTVAELVYTRKGGKVLSGIILYPGSRFAIWSDWRDIDVPLPSVVVGQRRPVDTRSQLVNAMNSVPVAPVAVCRERNAVVEYRV